MQNALKFSQITIVLSIKYKDRIKLFSDIQGLKKIVSLMHFTQENNIDVPQWRKDTPG
jgi:hypothetical protein